MCDSALRVSIASYVVTLKYPHYVPLMKNCSVAATRKTAEKVPHMVVFVVVVVYQSYSCWCCSIPRGCMFSSK